VIVLYHVIVNLVAHIILHLIQWQQALVLGVNSIMWMGILLVIVCANHMNRIMKPDFPYVIINFFRLYCLF